MYFNLAFLFIAISVTCVFGGDVRRCIEYCIAQDSLSIPKLEKGDYDIKEAELVGKDLKFKLDHGLQGKELMQMALEAAKSYSALGLEAIGKDSRSDVAKFGTIESDIYGKQNSDYIKYLSSVLGPEYKATDLSAADLEVLIKYLKHLAEDDLNLEKAIEKDHFKKFNSRDDSFQKKKAKMFEINGDKDLKTYLAESVLLRQTTKDEPYYNKEGNIKIPHFYESKSNLNDESGERSQLKYFSDEEKYMKGYKIINTDKEALEKVLEYIKESYLQKDVKLSEDAKKMYPLLKDLDMEYGGKLLGIGKEITEGKFHDAGDSLKKGISFGKGNEEIKHHSEESFKDFTFDEILKKAAHSVDKLHDEGKFKSKEGTMKEIGIGIDQKIKNIAKSEKDISIEELLKKDGYYMTGGTRAYEKARDQAHVDSKASFGDEKLKPKERSADGYVFDSKHFAEGVMKDKVFYDGKGSITHGKYPPESKLFDGEKFYFDEASVKEKSFYDPKVFGRDLAEGRGFDIGSAEDHHTIYKVKADDALFSFDRKDPLKETDKAFGDEKQKKNGFKINFTDFIKRSLRLRKCHLVTMRPGELLDIVDCVSKSRNPSLCEKFAMCETKMPVKVIAALERCQKETIPGELKKCTKFEPLYPSRYIPVKIFKCMAKSVSELSPDEKKQMIDFEKCARLVKKESCERIPWG